MVATGRADRFLRKAGGCPAVARRQLTFFASPKKVSKERRPQSRRHGIRCIGFRFGRRVPWDAKPLLHPPLLGPTGRCGTRARSGVSATGWNCARPQTVLADYSCRSCVARRLSSGPGRHAITAATALFWTHATTSSTGGLLRSFCRQRPHQCWGLHNIYCVAPNAFARCADKSWSRFSVSLSRASLTQPTRFSRAISVSAPTNACVSLATGM